MGGGHLDGLLAELATRSGVPLALDESGSCAVQYGDGAEVVLTAIEDGNTLLLEQPVQLLSKADPLVQLRLCLELSRYDAETAGLTLGLDRQTEWIVLWQRVPVAGSRCDDLEQALLTFMAAAARVRERLARLAPNHVAATPEPSVLGTQIMLLRV